MTTLIGYYASIPATISNIWVRTNTTYNLTGYLIQNNIVYTFTQIQFRYSYSGTSGGTSCSSGPGFCIGSVYGPSYSASGTLTIGSQTWTAYSSGNYNPGSVTFSSLSGTASQLIITGGSQATDTTVITQISRFTSVLGCATILDLDSINLPSGTHKFAVRASDDGATKNSSNLSDIVIYNEE